MKSVYIHIPFCNKICSYCDFCKFLYNEKWIKDYLDSLENEIKKDYKGEDIYSIYIGGGTPSCLDVKYLSKLFEIIKIFNINHKTEFTIECNIEDINEEKLKLFKENNINRLSIGIQTFNKKLLKFINRDNNIDIKEKVNLAKKYFDNINVDLMYAFENQTIYDLKNDLEKFLSLDVSHISCYSLILEENTKFKVDNINLIDEDLDYEMYKLILKTLESNSYVHYEVSNYSKKGYESKHNLVYWNNEEYYGFGVSAGGYIDNIRYTNSKNITNYNNKIYNKEIEKLDEKDKMKYEMILSLRKLNGINKNEFRKKYNKNIEDVFKIDELIKQKYLIDDGKNIYINKNYIYLSNEILINFI